MDWYQEENKDGTSKLYALKVQFLGPFLFGQQTLCVKVGRYTSLSGSVFVSSQSIPVLHLKAGRERLGTRLEISF